MSGELKKMSVTAFADLTASDTLAPGGGSVSVLFRSLPAALTGMVAGLIVGKKRYVEVEIGMYEVVAAAEALKKESAGEIDHNSDPFNEFVAAVAPPKNTDEEKAAWKVAMQNGLEPVAKVSCHVAKTAVRIFPFAKMVVERDSTNAVADGLVATTAARIAVIGADLSVRTNLASIEDEDLAAECSARVAVPKERAIAMEREIFALSELTREI